MSPDTTWSRPSVLPRREPRSTSSEPSRLIALLGEHRWTVGGLLLAQAMVVMFYLILVDNVSQLETKRASAASQARERHDCAMTEGRLMREQCFAALATSRPTEAIAVSLNTPR